MICSLCKKADVRPPIVCDNCGRLVCETCRQAEWEAFTGFNEKGPHRPVITCKFCLAERELST